MNKEDRKTVISWMVELNLLKGEITDLGRSWDANSKSIMSLKDEIHELQPRYEEIVKLLKNKGSKSIRTFDGLTANDIQPNFTKRKTDKIYETTNQNERRSRPKIISFFGFGRLKVEL